MYFKFKIMCTIALLLSSFSLFTSTRTVEIIRDVVVSESKVRLKDFVMNSTLLSDDEKDVILMDSPPYERDRKLSIFQLANFLKRQKVLMDAKLSGPRTISISRKVPEKNTTEFKREENSNQIVVKAKKNIIAYLTANPPWTDWTIDVLINKDDARKIEKIGSFATTKINNSSTTTMLGSVHLRMGFYDKSDNLIDELQITPVILRQMSVAVLRENLNSGDILSSVDIRMASIWVGQYKKSYVTRKVEYQGKELRRRVSAGELLKIRDLLDPVCAKRGDILRINCKSGGMFVSTMAKALQSGRKGEVIRVKNISSSKIYTVKLLGNKFGYLEM